MQNKVFHGMMMFGMMVIMAGSLLGCTGVKASAETKKTEAKEENVAVGAILLSVNPEIEVSYDEKGLVLEIEGINEEGKSVVADYHNYKGKSCAEAVSELVEEIYEDGYFEKEIDGHTKNIVVKLEEGSAYPDEAFLEAVADGVRKAVDACSMKSSPMLVREKDLDAQGRIGIEKAREIALAQLGLENAVFKEGEYDLDDNVYELEFTADGVEYEYEVDAITGKVRKADRERNDDWDAWDDDLDDRDDFDDLYEYEDHDTAYDYDAHDDNYAHDNYDDIYDHDNHDAIYDHDAYDAIYDHDDHEDIYDHDARYAHNNSHSRRENHNRPEHSGHR